MHRDMYWRWRRLNTAPYSGIDSLGLNAFWFKVSLALVRCDPWHDHDCRWPIDHNQGFEFSDHTGPIPNPTCAGTGDFPPLIDGRSTPKFCQTA